jgi:hypothetical protein
MLFGESYLFDLLRNNELLREDVFNLDVGFYFDNGRL